MLDDAADLYQELILSHARHPRHMRALPDANAHAHGENPLCGDTCEIMLRTGTGGSIDEIAFEGRGCAIMLASADVMAEAARTRSPDEIRDLANAFSHLVRTGETNSELGDLQAFAGLAEYPSRIKCATLPWAALRAALAGATEASSE